MYDKNLYEAINNTNTLTFGVRPVIILSNDIEVIKNGTEDGSTKAKACLIK